MLFVPGWSADSFLDSVQKPKILESGNSGKGQKEGLGHLLTLRGVIRQLILGQCSLK